MSDYETAAEHDRTAFRRHYLRELYRLIPTYGKAGAQSAIALNEDFGDLADTVDNYINKKERGSCALNHDPDALWDLVRIIISEVLGRHVCQIQVAAADDHIFQPFRREYMVSGSSDDIPRFDRFFELDEAMEFYNKKMPQSDDHEYPDRLPKIQTRIVSAWDPVEV